MKNQFVRNKPVWTTQRDNYDQSSHPEFHNQCMVESWTYLWRWFWKELLKLDSYLDDRAYYAILMDSMRTGESRYDWNVHSRVTNAWLDSQNRPGHIVVRQTKKYWNTVLQSIKNGVPVVLGIDIRKALNSKTEKGHVVFLVGLQFDESDAITGVFLLDPYGNINTKYQDKNGDTICVPIADMLSFINENSHCAIYEEAA